jgi:hypothetical protein
MEIQRPRKMELLYTPKSELSKLMRENSITADEVVFLFQSNKLSAFDIRINAPNICDRLLDAMLRRSGQVQKELETASITA